jgi:c-di-GMP-binding flagellar brake protein YcgR
LIQGRVVDLSHGGLGIVCDHLLPRMCEGTIRIFDTPSEPDAECGPRLFEHQVKVHRVGFIREPLSYALGLGFVDAQPDIMQQRALVLEKSTPQEAPSLDPQGGDDA